MYYQITTAMQLTARQIRQTLFTTDKSVVINGDDDRTNEDARRWFYDLEDQDQTFNVIENPDHFLIWN